MFGIWLSELQMQIFFDPAEPLLGIYLLDINALVKNLCPRYLVQYYSNKKKKWNNLIITKESNCETSLQWNSMKL